jgi:hypothetical protein
MNVLPLDISTYLCLLSFLGYNSPCRIVRWNQQQRHYDVCSDRSSKGVSAFKIIPEKCKDNTNMSTRRCKDGGRQKIVICLVL